ncbi:hypothetical protein DH2020_017905 [Rehmannia glutinosa]|uniref:non-specific serine/threonine protein kinase n=1 Tax=Rehmannia glutinosa TaxID=99300 RepID=A0ABR0WHB4_REHGL
MGPISASFGDYGLFCAIDASGKQAVICWDANNSSSTASSSLHYSTVLPSMAALSGGEGFLCGILANTSQALCWDSMGLSRSSDLVPPVYKPNAYSHIAAGKDHVCAIRGSYYSDNDSGSVDCWDIVRVSNNSLSSTQSGRFYDQNASISVFRKLVSGNGFTCGVIRDGGISCWGPNSGGLGVSGQSDNYLALASGLDSICGISQMTGEIKCWGDSDSYDSPPVGIRFVSLSAGAQHFCGIREDNHGIECWGNFNASLIPKGPGFLAIASSNFVTCGIREGDLVLDCWFSNLTSPADYDPPLQLCSPGLCRAGACGEGMFAFNASLLNEPDLTSLCFARLARSARTVRVGVFASWSPYQRRNRSIGIKCVNFSSLSGLPFGILANFARVVSFTRVMVTNNEQGEKQRYLCCIRKPKPETDENANQHPPASVAPCPGVAQIFRLSELKDATNGFKEFNELGRGATVLSTKPSSRTGGGGRYCSEMGERLLVYEFMPHGSLHDHLHGGLSTLNWSLRLKIAMQAAKGLEYLHKEVIPPIVHREVKSSKILLDADWGARISDFGLLTPNERDVSADMRMDVYGFGVVLLEILSGRKAYDGDCMPANIVDWALPQIKQGKAAAVIDRYVALPRNVEPLLKLADIAELALREDPNERVSMSDLAVLLEQLVKDGLIL